MSESLGYPAHTTFHDYLSSVPECTIFKVLCGRRKELGKISFEAPRLIQFFFSAIVLSINRSYTMEDNEVFLLS